MKKLIVLLTLMVGVLLTCPAPVMAWVDPLCDPNSPSYLTDPDAREAAGCDENRTLFDAVPGAVTAIFSVVGIIAAAMIVFGGVRYSMSQGDPGKVKKAKDTIMYSVIGLVVTLLSYAIVAFILGNL